MIWFGRVKPWSSTSASSERDVTESGPWFPRIDVPLIAAVYLDDLYVDSALQLDTLDRVGNSRAWVTNEFEHDGVRTGPVLERLLDMGSGRL